MDKTGIRILYGVSGEGSGHSSRAKEIITHLESQGHIVKVISYDRGYKNLSPLFDTEEIFGLRFDYKDNKVRAIPTAFKNLIKLPVAQKSIKRVSRIVDEFKPQMIFSDFEPISSIVANWKKISLVSIDNQHRLTNMEIEYPKKYTKDALMAKAVTKLMVYNTKACLVTTFFFSKITNKKTFLFPPILRSEVLNLKPSNGGHILVYLTTPFEELINALKSIDKKFIVYGFDKDKIEENIVFKKASKDGFLKDLASCEGVVANAGFTLMTEALHLNKPYLALPVAGQFEQILNAYYLEKLGYGKHWDELDKEKIESFLNDLELYKANLAKYKKEDNSKILKKIEELIKEYTS